jgi:anthranilate 1,2-dioxygenase small subunit
MSAKLEAIRSFFNVYAELLDEEKFEAWTELFEPEACTYRVLSRENQDLGLPLPIMGCYSHGMVRDRVAMLAKGVLTYRRDRLLRQVTNVQCQPLSESLLDARANLVVYQSSEEGVSRLYMVARYRAILRPSGDNWLIKSMDVVVDSFGIDTMLAVPL